jgi:alkylation response protein AidB-like acyl-CoA dehydrogenase
MDLRYTDAEQEFRGELRSWLDSALPLVGPEPARDDWAARREDETGWQRVLFDAGYAGINWPAEYGGRGATPTEHLIFLEETERARAPYVGMNFVGLLHAGPTLIVEASDEQKAAHLPGILQGEHVWCQGFSEPGAGSDLASLSCRAFRDGDDYVVTGQKIWTSFAHVADYCEMLVRTDPDAPKHKGISWVIMDMTSPGIDVRPLRTMEGSTEFCEMYLDEVRIPVASRVGAENDGWRVAMTTLSFERGTAFVSEMLQTMKLCRDLADLAEHITRGSATAWDDAGLQRDLGRVAAELDALWALTKRNISEATRTGLVGPGGSVFKLAYTDLRHRLGEIALHLLDRASLSLDDLGELPTGEHVRGRIHGISMTIAAGTTQVQKNIIAERILGLPKEPAVGARGVVK